MTRQAITAFRHRHAAEIEPPIAQVEQAVIDVAIRNKEERIRRLAGLEGTLTRTLAGFDGDPRGAAALTTQIRGCLRDVAEELNRCPPAVSISNESRTYVLTWADGTPALVAPGSGSFQNRRLGTN